MNLKRIFLLTLITALIISTVMFVCSTVRLIRSPITILKINAPIVYDTVYYNVLDEIQSNKVTLTTYHAVEYQCDSDYLITAANYKIESTETAFDHKYIAVSRDLLKLYPYGSIVYVSGSRYYDGLYKVADTMNKRYKNCIDILTNPNMKVEKTDNVNLILIKSSKSY